MADIEHAAGTALFVTALELEAEAVAAHLEDDDWDTHPSGSQYRQGWWTGSRARWRVVIVEAGMGPEEAAAATARAIDHFSPALAVFVGVAGGLKDVGIGDVVVASDVIGFEYGKDGTDFRPRGKHKPSSFRPLERAKRVRTEKLWPQRADPPADGCKALIGPIAAGSKVVADSRSPSARLLRDTYSQAVAVEMEGLGFLRAAYQSPGTEAIVVRGISDLLDDKAAADAGGSQPRAAAHAAAFAFELLELQPVPGDDGDQDGDDRDEDGGGAPRAAAGGRAPRRPSTKAPHAPHPPAAPATDRLVFVSQAPEVLAADELGSGDTIGRHRYRKEHIRLLTAELAASLAPTGHRLWLPDAGRDDGERIDPGALTCDLAVALIDRDALRSERMAREATVLLWLHRFGLPVVPVLLGDVTRPRLLRSPLKGYATEALPPLAFGARKVNAAVRGAQVEGIGAALVATEPWRTDGPTRRWIKDVARFIAAVPDDELPRLAGHLDVSVDELDRTGDRRQALASALLGSDVEGAWHFVRHAAEYLDRGSTEAVVRRVAPIWVDLESAKLILDVADLPDGSRVCGFETTALRLGEHIVRRATASDPEYTAVRVPEITGEDAGRELLDRYDRTLRHELNLSVHDGPDKVAEDLADHHAAVFVLLRCTDMNPQVTSNLIHRLGDRFPGITFILLAERNSAIWRGIRGIHRSPHRWTAQEERAARGHVSRLHQLVGQPISVDSDE